jgi:filamentous hemagglutinin family protein
MSGALAPAEAQPSGGVVVSGQAGITGGETTTLINQSTRKAIINWQDFSVAAGGTVQFVQPDAQSITLNRVIGTGASAVNGTLTANGQVWILNPNGVLFGNGARVNVGGLLATTADIADSDFNAGQYRFGGGSGAGVVNDGVIHAANGGSVVLSAARVSNRGLVQADAGSVVLGGATAFTLDFTGDNLLRYAVATGAQAPASGEGTAAQVSNSGKIAAAGGKVLLTARAAANVLDGVINNTGIIEAVTAREVNGQIILDAGDGTVTAGGTLDVSGTQAGETGGSVQVLGKTVEVADGAQLSASGDTGGGEILIGGNFRGEGPLANAEATTVGKATITADALTNGDGGQVVVWSDGKTRFAGAISARGGALSGDGGQVETSGALLGIDAGAEVITSAPAGSAGNWLLDPDDLFIVDSGTEDTALSGGVLAFGDGGTTILTTTIETALLNGNVTLQANNDINVQGSVNVESSNTLELDAGRSIVFSGSGSLINDGIGGRIVLSANDPGANASKRGAGAGVISSDGFNSIHADEIDLIVGAHADGGGIGASDKMIVVDGNLHIETAGYDAFIDSFGLVLGNAAHAQAVDLNGGDLTLRVTGLTQTAPIATGDLNIQLVGDVSSPDPISLMNANNAIAGTVNVMWAGGTFGGPDQVEITNSQAITLGDISLFYTDGNYGGIEIVTTAGGITIAGDVSGGKITLTAAGDIVEAENGTITSYGTPDGSTGGSLSATSSGGKISLLNDNYLVAGISCIDVECYPSPQEKLAGGTLTADSAGDAAFNFVTPVAIEGAASGGDFSLTVTGETTLFDEFGGEDSVPNSIEIIGKVIAADFIDLHAKGNIVQRVSADADVHLEAIGLKAASELGSIDLDNGGNGTTDPGNKVGGDINGYVTLNSAGDAKFTNTVDTILGGPAYYPIDEETNEQVDPLYPFEGTPTLPPDGYIAPVSTIGGNLKVNIVDTLAPGNEPVLVIAGKVHAENNEGGYSVLRAEGDIASNNGYGTIIVGTDGGEFNNLSLVSDQGTVGGNDGTEWVLGVGTQTGTLNLHAEAENGAIVLNPRGDLNIGILDGQNQPVPELDGGLTAGANVVIFGNGFVTQNLDSSGVIETGGLDVHARDDVTLTNDFNKVTGSVDFYVAEHFDGEAQQNVASDITFRNSVNTTVSRAAGDGDDANGAPKAAGNVTITVSNPFGEGTPSLTLGNRLYTNSKGQTFLVGIKAEGDVLLEADGGVFDGYIADVPETWGGAGNIAAEGNLTVRADGGDISLANPVNAVKGDVDLTAGPHFIIETPFASDITFANSLDTTLVRANGGGMNFDSTPVKAGNVTILVSDPLGVGSPSLTLGNVTEFDEGDNPVVSSIDAEGNVILLAAGVMSDGFDPDNGETQSKAGHVRADGTLTVTSANDQIWLRNPDNSFIGLTATTNNKDVKVTASSPTQLLTVNGIDAGTGNVLLTVNDSDVVSQSGVIIAGDLTVSTHDTFFDNCVGDCPVSPVPYEIYLVGSNKIGGTIMLAATGGATIKNAQDTVLGTSSAGWTLTVLSEGDLEIAEGAAITGGDAGEDDASVILSAAGAFHNNAGSDAISVPVDQRWLVYSANPDDNTYGGLDSGNTAVWNTVYDPDGFISQPGNRYVFAYQPVITVTSTDVEKTFGDDATAEVAAAYTVTGLHEGVEGAFLGDDAESIYSGTPSVTSEGAKADANVEDSPYTIDVASGSFEVFGGYGVSFVSAGLLTVDPLATLYYVADPTSRVYGQDNPVFTGHVEGFLEGDTQQNSTTGTLVFTSEATKASSVGEYAIIGSGLSSKNYAFAQDPDNATALTITKATLTYEADEKSRTYGADNPAFTGTVTGFVNGDTLEADTDGTLAFGSTATKTSGVGSYAIDGSGLTAENYDFVQAEGNATALTIDPATLTYVADAKDRTYGAANPAFTGTVTGFVNGEGMSVTEGTLVFTSDATKTSNVGSYAIEGGGLTADNYVFVQAAGNATALTVDPATLTYVADAKSRTYGSANPAFTGAVTGFVNDEDLSVTSGTLVFTSEATSADNVGSYAIDGGGLTATNYVFVQAGGNATALTITKATLTYTADKATRSYGEDNPAFTGSVTGFVNGDTLVLDTTGTLAFTSDATAASNVGSYAINGSGLSAQNYDFVQAAGNATALTIDPAILTYNAVLMSRIYGEDNPEFSGTVTGFVNGDTLESDTDGTLVFTSDATAASNVGTYAILGSGLTAQNYVFVQAAGNGTALTIDPATLTYTANTASRTYGAANPAFGGTVTGFVNGDTLAADTTGTLVFTSPATAASNVGSYAINGSGLSAQNYVFVQAAGNSTALTINPATLTYIADTASRTYGAANPAFTGTVTGFVNGDTLDNDTTGTLLFTSPATAASNVGSYAINGSGLSAQNYVFVQASGNSTALTINPATLTYTANAASRTYGAANPAFSGTVTGFVNGDTQQSATTGTLAFTSPAAPNSNVGKYAITGAGLAAQNYVFVQAASNATAFTITPATLTISLTGTVTKPFDGTVMATLTAGNYTSLSGVLFNDDVALAGLPTTGAYDTPDAGTGKLVTVSGLTLTGAKAGNYIIAGQVSGPVGVITSGQPTGGPLGPPLTGVVVTNTQTFDPTNNPGTVIDTLNQSAGNETGGPAGSGSMPPPPANNNVNPLENLANSGGQDQGDPPTTSDSAITYIVDSFDSGPPQGSDDPNAIIPTLLHSAPGGSQGGPLDYSSIPGWGNVALWQ